MAKPQGWETEVRPGTEISSGLVTTSSVMAAVVGEGVTDGVVELVGLRHADAVQPAGAGDRGQVRLVEHGAELGQATRLLLQPDHAQASVAKTTSFTGSASAMTVASVVRNGRSPYVRTNSAAASGLNKLRRPEIAVGCRIQEQRLDPHTGIARQQIANLGHDRSRHE